MSSDSYYALESTRAELLGLGLDETMTYSTLAADAATAGTGVSEEQLVRLANPLSSEAACLRPSLLPGVLQSVAHNVAHNNNDLAFFELGRVLVHAEQLPEERDQVAIVLSGRPHPERFGAERERTVDFFDLKGVLEGWFAARRLAAVTCKSAEHPAFKPATCAVLCAGGLELAVFGQVADELTDAMRLKHPLFIALVELDEVRTAPSMPKIHKTLPQFPAVVRDISLVAEQTFSNQEIVDTIRAARGQWLERVELFDVYEDDAALGPGRRSLAYSLTYRNTSKTLTDEEVNSAHETVRNALAALRGVELR